MKITARQRLLNDYNILLALGIGIQEAHRILAKEYGYKVSAVRGTLSKARHEPAKIIHLHPDMYEPTARDWSNYPEWQQYVNRELKSVDGLIRVMIWPDLHIPDHDPQAVELALQIENLLQPHINLFTGDEFDFDRLSTKFPRASNRKSKDAFQEAAGYWNDFISRLCLQSPRSKKIVIPGNHTRGRVENYANQKAPELAETIIEAFINLVRSNNRVLWLGWTDELVLGDALFEHGERTGESAAKNALKDLGWTMPGTDSHTHSPGWFLNVSLQASSDGLTLERRLIERIVTPCLCNIHPHYRKDKKKSRWVQGAATAHVNLHGQDVHLRNYIFYPRADGSLVTVFGASELIQQVIEGQQRKVEVA